MQSRDELVVKEVDFLGDTLVAAKDRYGKIWAGVSYFCRGLGMSKAQKDTQVERVQSDNLLMKGAGKFPAGVFDEHNETVALRIDFVPMWLATISITQSMKKKNPKMAEKLLEYQLKAKDVLAEAFLPACSPTKFPCITERPGEVANLLKVLNSTMRKEGLPEHKIAENSELICAQYGISVIADFVKIPAYEQIQLPLNSIRGETL